MSASSGLLRIPVPPLLEMEGDAGVHALVADPPDPVRMRGPSLAAAFSARDDPVQCLDMHRQIQGAQEWLATQKPIPTGNIRQKTDTAVSEVLIFDTRSQPDMGRPGIFPRNHSPGKMRTLGKQQPVEIGSLLDKRPESLPQAVQSRVPLEDIRHRRAEHARATSCLRRMTIPKKRLVPIVIAELPPGSIRAPNIVSGALRPSFRVTVVACRRNFRATPPRVERMGRPFDC